MTVLVPIEIEGDTVATSSLEALTLAADVAGSGEPVQCAAFGGPATTKAGVLAAIAGYGVTGLHVLEHEMLVDYSPEACGESLAQLLTQLGPAGVLAAGTDRGNEILAQAAARAGLPLASNCVAVASGDPWALTRVRAGGMLLEDAELAAPVKLVTIVPGAIKARDAEAGPAGHGDEVDVRTFAPQLDDGLARSRIVDRAKRGDGVTLATARVVVSGGRGVGSAEGFASLEELADVLGGAVGCSRVATNNGWRSHSDQVGQTGTKVSPELYVACGISGATQHWVGCMGASAILAINTDAEAPMVTRSTYAVIGDVHDVLPALIDEIRRRSHGARRS